MPSSVVLETNLTGLPVRRGKVRDVYDLGDSLLLVATDRISAFDWVLPSGIPNKGQILSRLSAFWFGRLGEPNHLLSCDVADMPLPQAADRMQLAGRTTWVKKTSAVPIECVVRGYLAGSGWKEYCRQGTVCGLRLPAGLRESEQLAEPIFTPATKAESGHDENISFETMCGVVGVELSEELRRRSLAVYQRGAEHARRRGIIVADTKFEWGLIDEGGQRRLILIDEILTPDSSRFWPVEGYQPGRGQPSFDKQFVRDWLELSGWDKQSHPPRLPDDIIAKTRAKYVEAFELLTGERFVPHEA